MLNKQKIHEACLTALQIKIDSLKQINSELKEAAANETKSTAGDKHETALAMVQLEQEKLSKQISSLLDQKALLSSIDLSKQHYIVSNGSLVETNKGLFYFAIPLGKLSVDEISLNLISIQSPIGNLFSGLKVGDSVQFNNLEYKIISIL